MTAPQQTRPLVVAFTGHRELSDAPRVAAALQAELAALAARSGGPLTLICGLAEGADRLAAHEALRLPGGVLHALLPLTPVDYEHDFATEASRAEFRALCARAVAVEVAPAQASRGQAYLAAGQEAVERCDIVLAVWDGQPARGVGGTADVVAWARARGKTMILIDDGGAGARPAARP